MIHIICVPNNIKVCCARYINCERSGKGVVMASNNNNALISLNTHCVIYLLQAETIFYIDKKNAQLVQKQNPIIRMGKIM